ncbi:hypothetical protein [Pseudomonas hormoni]
MRIKLSPQRRDESLQVVKSGAVLTINGEDFDFTRMVAGDTLPASAITSVWFPADVEHTGAELVVTLTLPNPWNYSQEQAFPVDLVDVPDGPVVFPQPLPDPLPPALKVEGEIEA